MFKAIFGCQHEVKNCIVKKIRIKKPKHLTAIGLNRYALGSDMMFTGCYHRLLKFLAVCGLLLAAASCTLVEKRIDRTADGPNVPADTACLLYTSPSPRDQRPNLVFRLLL